MERIEKLTDIYMEHIGPLNGNRIDKTTLQGCLVEVLDTIGNGSRSTSSSMLGLSPSRANLPSKGNTFYDNTSKGNNTITSESSGQARFDTQNLKLAQFPEILSYLVQVFQHQK